MPMGDYGPRYVLFGIVSVGVPSCGKFSLPAVYTNVSNYLPWIYDNINWMKYANCYEQDDGILLLLLKCYVYEFVMFVKCRHE